MTSNTRQTLLPKLNTHTPTLPRSPPLHFDRLSTSDKLSTSIGLGYGPAIGRGVVWLDAGTHESLLQASQFVYALQERQGLMMSCVEEIAYRRGFIDLDQLRELA